MAELVRFRGSGWRSKENKNKRPDVPVLVVLDLKSEHVESVPVRLPRRKRRFRRWCCRLHSNVPPAFYFRCGCFIILPLQFESEANQPTQNATASALIFFPPFVSLFRAGGIDDVM